MNQETTPIRPSLSSLILQYLFSPSSDFYSHLLQSLIQIHIHPIVSALSQMPLLLQIHTPPQSSSPVFLHPSIALFPLHFILLSLHLLRIPPPSLLSPSDSYRHSIASESSLFISHITLHGGISRPLAPPNHPNPLLLPALPCLPCADMRVLAEVATIASR